MTISAYAVSPAGPAQHTIQDAWGHGYDDPVDMPSLPPVSSNEPFIGSQVDFVATLDADKLRKAGMATNSTGNATATFQWSKNQDMLQYVIRFFGFGLGEKVPGMETISGIHIHMGLPGDNDHHALNIYGPPVDSAIQPHSDDPDLIINTTTREFSGIWGDNDTLTRLPDAARSKQLSDMRDRLCNTNLYLQIHTDWNPTGAIRGQIEPISELCAFDLAADDLNATINAAQVIPASESSEHSINGTARFVLDDDREKLYYWIQFSGLDVYGNLTNTDADDLDALHLHAGAAGSTGPHILNIFGAPCKTGEQSYPACDDKQMTAHPGGIISGIYDDSDMSDRFSEAGRSKKLTDIMGLLCNDLLYLQAHTPHGNIRGQVLLQDDTICDFPQHDDFVAIINSSQLVDDTQSNATGIANLRFNSGGDRLQYEIHLAGIDTDHMQTQDTKSDNLAAIHLHNAPAGQNSHVHLFNIFGPPSTDDDLVNMPGTGTISGIWDDADETLAPSEAGRSKALTENINEICDGLAYINIHTVAHPDGEIRGQILPTPDNILCDFGNVADFTSSINASNVQIANNTSMSGHHPTHGNIHVGTDHADVHHAETDNMASIDSITADAEYFFSDDLSRLYYEIRLSGADTTGEQTLDTTHDDLEKIHIHIGNSTSTGGHAFDIMSPNDDDLRIDNGTATVTGIWDDTHSAHHSATHPHALANYYEELCHENLYLQVHLNGGNIRGQIIPVQGNTACMAPSVTDIMFTNSSSILVRFSTVLDSVSSDYFVLHMNGSSVQSVSHDIHNMTSSVTLGLDPPVSPEFALHGTLMISSEIKSKTGFSIAGHANHTLYPPGPEPDRMAVTPLTGDWDGDGDDDVGVTGMHMDPARQYFLLNANGTVDTVFDDTFGDISGYLPGSIIPLAGDWDGDGIDEIGISGIAAGMVHAMLQANHNVISYHLGSSTAKSSYVLAGDWDGDGTDDLGHAGINMGLQQFRLHNPGGNDASFTGAIGDDSHYKHGTLRPLVGDWDGDGDDDVGAMGISRDSSEARFTLHVDGTDHAVFAVHLGHDNAHTGHNGDTGHGGH